MKYETYNAAVFGFAVWVNCAMVIKLSVAKRLVVASGTNGAIETMQLTKKT